MRIEWAVGGCGTLRSKCRWGAPWFSTAITSCRHAALDRSPPHRAGKTAVPCETTLLRQDYEGRAGGGKSAVPSGQGAMNWAPTMISRSAFELDVTRDDGGFLRACSPP